MDYKKISYEALQRVSVSTTWTDDAIKRVADYLESALQNTAHNSDHAICHWIQIINGVTSSWVSSCGGRNMKETFSSCPICGMPCSKHFA